MNHSDFCELFNVYETTVRNLLQFPSRHTQEQKDIARLAIIREWEAAQSSPASMSAEPNNFNPLEGANQQTRDQMAAVIGIRDLQSAENRPARDDVRTPRYDEWRYLREHGQWRDGVPSWARGYNGAMDDMTAAHAVIEELAAIVKSQSAKEPR